MKRVIILVAIITIAISSFSQILPVKYRVEKQSMSRPMTIMEEVFFNSPYYSKPVNVNFDGKSLHMFYDNKAPFVKTEVTEVSSNADFDDCEDQQIKRYYYTFNNNCADTMIFVVDYDVAYVQVILPAKNSKGDKIGYTSYKNYMSKDQLAFN